MGKNLQLYRARNLLFACEIFLAHKSWSINQRVVIPVNLISVDRESEKVAPPRRFLDRSAPPSPFFFFPFFWDARISKRPRVSRVYYSFRGWEKGRPHATKQAETRKPASGELLLLYRFVFALFALRYSQGKILGRHIGIRWIIFGVAGGINLLVEGLAI